MYLSNGVVNKAEAISQYGSVKNLFDYLVTSHSIVADIYINDILITSSIATFSTNSGYVIASVSAKFAFTDMISFEKINIDLHEVNSNINIIESCTEGLSEWIPSGDVDADIRFKVGSIFPYNELKYETPESHFNSMHKDDMVKIDFATLSKISLD